jgi:hypothetical protein
MVNTKLIMQILLHPPQEVVIQGIGGDHQVDSEGNFSGTQVPYMQVVDSRNIFEAA